MMFQIMSKVICVLNTPPFHSIRKAAQRSMLILLVVFVIANQQNIMTRKSVSRFFEGLQMAEVGFIKWKGTAAPW